MYFVFISKCSEFFLQCCSSKIRETINIAKAMQLPAFEKIGNETIQSIIIGYFHAQVDFRRTSILLNRQWAFI